MGKKLNVVLSSILLCTTLTTTASAKFLSVDPVTFQQTGNPAHFNRYAYANNDPINRIDPNGEESFLISRPLSGPPGVVANHMFVVVVDPQTQATTRFSYGPQGDPVLNPGKLVSHPTNLTGTGRDDNNAMKAFLSHSGKAAEEGIVGVQIDAPDSAVLASGAAMDSLLGTPTSPGANAPNYSPITSNPSPATSGSNSNFSPGPLPARAGTANSNSAAIGVANRATGTSNAVPPGTLNPGVNQEHVIPDYEKR